jgi:hypothetical protein
MSTKFNSRVVSVVYQRPPLLKNNIRVFFFRATTYFINRKSSYMSKQTWKLKDKDRPGENSCPGHFAEKNLTDRKIQNHP